jgi:hypothetical protein
LLAAIDQAQGELISRYFLVVVLAVFGCLVKGAAQEKPLPMPVIDCVVEYSHGWFDSYGAVTSGDTITLDLNAINKISLHFKSKNPGPSYMWQPGPFRLEGDAKPEWTVLKLISSAPEGWVTINIRRSATTQQYDIIIILEEGGDVGLVVMKGTARD